ncbi:type II secretion system protein [Planctomycetota bacterium]
MKKKVKFSLVPSSGPGFTLVEILVVVAILGLLLGGVVAIGSHVRTNAQIKNTKSVMSTLVTAIEEYKLYYSSVPDDLLPLGDLLPIGDPPAENDPPNVVLQKWPYFDGIILLYQRLNQVPACRAILEKIPEKNTILFGGEVVLVDSWKNERINQLNWLHYEYIPGYGNSPVIRSAGPDTKFGTADDILSTEL